MQEDNLATVAIWHSTEPQSKNSTTKLRAIAPQHPCLAKGYDSFQQPHLQWSSNRFRRNNRKGSDNADFDLQLWPHEVTRSTWRLHSGVSQSIRSQRERDSLAYACSGIARCLRSGFSNLPPSDQSRVFSSGVPTEWLRIRGSGVVDTRHTGITGLRQQALKFAHNDVLHRYTTNLVILHAVSLVSWAGQHFGYLKNRCVPYCCKVEAIKDKLWGTNISQLLSMCAFCRISPANKFTFTYSHETSFTRLHASDTILPPPCLPCIELRHPILSAGSKALSAGFIATAAVGN